MWGISWLAQKRLASQEGFCCMEWVSITFRDMPLGLVDCTIQVVWSFCNNQLTVIMDRTTRTSSGAEEILLHVAVWSTDLIIRLHLSVGTFNTCTAPTGLLEMTTGCSKLLPSDYCLHIAICIMQILSSWFAAVYRFLPKKIYNLLPFLRKIFIISAS